MREIQLTKGKVALVDDEDYEELAQYKWCVTHYGYAVRSGWSIRPGSMILMHREIMGNPVDREIDHINGDKLDNRQSNLRIVTKRQNLFNKPVRSDSKLGVKGVRLRQRAKTAPKFEARLAGRNIGTFDTLIEAARAYDIQAKIVHGEYARLNNYGDN